MYKHTLSLFFCLCLCFTVIVSLSHHYHEWFLEATAVLVVRKDTELIGMHCQWEM